MIRIIIPASAAALWQAVQADVAMAVFITACAVLALLITYAGASSTATDDRLRQRDAETAAKTTTAEREEPAA